LINASEIIWSTRAIKEWIDILEYWSNRNRSYTYSSTLDQLFKEKFNILTNSPDIGKPTDFAPVRLKIIRDYLVYYRLKDEHIEILAIWDSRRDPKKFKL